MIEVPEAAEKREALQEENVQPITQRHSDSPHETNEAPSQQDRSAHVAEASKNQTSASTTAELPEQHAPQATADAPMPSPRDAISLSGPAAGRQPPTNGRQATKPTASAAIPLLCLPALSRQTVVDEHDSHRERLEAIASGRAVSQTSVASRQSHVSSVSPRHRRNPVDPVIQTLFENHQKALIRIKQHGPRLPQLEVVHWPRLGNTHAPKDEFIGAPVAVPSAVAADGTQSIAVLIKNPPARERRLEHNSYRNERLVKAERVDAENAKLVAALVNAKPMVLRTSALLHQERERQEMVRRIERGSHGGHAATARAELSASDAVVKESRWDNHVNAFLPKPPILGTIVAAKDGSKPKLLWEEKSGSHRNGGASRATQGPSASSVPGEVVEGGEEHHEVGEGGSGPSATLMTSKGTDGSQLSFKPKPPPVTLQSCLEKPPAVSSGRHTGFPSPEKMQHVKSKTDTGRSPKKSDPIKPESGSEKVYHPDQSATAHADDEEIAPSHSSQVPGEHEHAVTVHQLTEQDKGADLPVDDDKDETAEYGAVDEAENAAGDVAVYDVSKPQLEDEEL